MRRKKPSANRHTQRISRAPWLRSIPLQFKIAHGSAIYMTTSERPFCTRASIIPARRAAKPAPPIRKMTASWEKTTSNIGAPLCARRAAV